MRCKKCKGECEPITRGGKFVFEFCRPCKIPYTAQGAAIFNSGSQLASAFNPLAASRGIIEKTQAGASPVARTALEVLMAQSLWDSYYTGLKDGVMLAYSQDVGSSSPVEVKDGSLHSSAGDT
jgi:hypothetical protein